MVLLVLSSRGVSRSFGLISSALSVGLLAVVLTGQGNAQRLGPAYEQEPWGQLPATDKGRPQPVTRYTLINANNLVVRCLDYGAIITEIRVPDKNGQLADIVLGFDKLDGYLKDHPYFGANVGRCANRIAKAAFTL
ncbi:MAG: hypothetical protein NZ703_14680, partial [Gemmataceae bacterium]|nr:hypothetical protein [Gemmataceae bacterium]